MSQNDFHKSSSPSKKIKKKRTLYHCITVPESQFLSSQFPQRAGNFLSKLSIGFQRGTRSNGWPLRASRRQNDAGPRPDFIRRSFWMDLLGTRYRVARYTRNDRRTQRLKPREEKLHRNGKERRNTKNLGNSRISLTLAKRTAGRWKPAERRGNLLEGSWREMKLWAAAVWNIRLRKK